MRLIAVLFALLAFHTRAVLSFFKSVSFSMPQQCAPFVVNFSNSTSAPVLPLSLTVVPIASNPITLMLPTDSWDNSSNSGAARITFLPFPSGTQFVASLDDRTGSSIGIVSDVLSVQDSNVTSCLPPGRNTNFYRVHGNLTQCSTFNVAFDSSTIQRIPTIRAFLPRSFSYFVNATETPVRSIMPGRDPRSGHGSDQKDNEKFDVNGGHKNDSSKIGNSNNGNNNNNHDFRNISSKEYVLDVLHGFQAILAFDDGEGHRESSRLFTAGGTSSSPSSCFKEAFNFPSHLPGASSTPGPFGKAESGLSRAGKITVSVLGASVGVSVAVIIFIILRRRRRVRRDAEKTSFIFTEDVDLGSPFTSLASRLRARISQLTYGKRSHRSYRSYRDEKDDASAWVPTSPIGSPTAASSWHTFLPPRGKDIGNFTGPETATSACDSRTKEAAQRYGSISLLEFEFISPTPAIPAEARIRPDVPRATFSRSFESSRFLLGSGYLSSHSSGAPPNVQNNGSDRSDNNNSSLRSNLSEERPTFLPVLSSNFSYSECMPSRSSSATPQPEDSGIYVSSPIHPSFEIPHSGYSQPDTRIPSLPGVHDDNRSVSKSSTLIGTLRRDGSRKDPGRALPFPISSLRASRSSRR